MSSSYIKTAHTNNITENILVYYDKKLSSQNEILNLFTDIISDYSITAYRNEQETAADTTFTGVQTD